MHTPQPTIYGYGRNVHLWHFPWPKRPKPKCPGRNVLGRNVRGRNVLHSSDYPRTPQDTTGSLYGKVYQVHCNRT